MTFFVLFYYLYKPNEEGVYEISLSYSPKKL